MKRKNQEKRSPFRKIGQVLLLSLLVIIALLLAWDVIMSATVEFDGQIYNRLLHEARLSEQPIRGCVGKRPGLFGLLELGSICFRTKAESVQYLDSIVDDP